MHTLRFLEKDNFYVWDAVEAAGNNANFMVAQREVYLTGNGFQPLPGQGRWKATHAHQSVSLHLMNTVVDGGDGLNIALCCKSYH